MITQIMSEEKVELTFKDKWHAEKALKKAKKKVKKTLQQKGFSASDANKMMKKATNTVMANRPPQRAAGRGG